MCYLVYRRILPIITIGGILVVLSVVLLHDDMMQVCIGAVLATCFFWCTRILFVTHKFLLPLVCGIFVLGSFTLVGQTLIHGASDMITGLLYGIVATYMLIPTIITCRDMITSFKVQTTVWVSTKPIFMKYFPMEHTRFPLGYHSPSDNPLLFSYMLVGHTCTDDRVS